MAEENNTGAAGAVPANKGANADSPTGADAKSDSSPDVVVDEKGKPLPYDKQPKWVAARAAEKKLNDLLKANDLTDPDDLLDLVQRGKTVKGKLADLNQLDGLIEKATKLDKYEAYWKEQEELQKRQGEDPDQTIKRLEGKLNERERAEARRRAETEHVENTKRAISAYETEVHSLIGEIEVPKEQRAFVAEFFGVGNPCNDIDITDRKAVKKLVADGLKKKEAYDQAVIKAYLESKKGIPAVTSTAGTSADGTKPKIMLKDARKIFLETMQKAASGG
jgi:hypothetical protein